MIMANYGDNGYIDFSKLWEMMEKKKIKKEFLRKNGVHANTVSKLVKNENVTCEVIATLCALLKCQPGQIMKYVPAPDHNDSTPAAPDQGDRSTEDN